MNIYIAHSNKFDYITKLYEPIKNAKVLSNHNLFFPHGEVNKLVKTKEIIENYDLGYSRSIFASYWLRDRIRMG